MVDVAQLGIQVNSAPAVKAADDLDDLAISAGRADGAVTRLATASNRMAPQVSNVGRSAFQASGGVRLLGMQMSQVVQQTAATGNAAQALAIQAADIGSMFGALGAAIGIVATVALPTVIAAFTGASDSARKVTDALDQMDDKVNAYTEAAAAASVTTQELAEKYGLLAGEARAALEAMSDVALVGAIQSTQAAIDGVLGSLTEFRTYASSDLLGASETALVLRDAFDMTNQEAASLRRALEELSRAQGLEAQAVAAGNVREALMGAYGSVSAMPKPLQDAYAAMARITLAAGEAKSTIDGLPSLLAQAQAAAAGAAAAVGGIGTAASNAYGAVSALVGKMSEMAQARQDYSQSVGGGRGLGPQGPALDPYGFRKQLERTGNLGGGGAGGGGGGGGGGADPFQAEFEALQESLMGREAAQTESYERQQEMLQTALERRLVTQQEYNALMQEAENEHAWEMYQIKEQESEMVRQAAQGMYGALGDLLGVFAGKSKTAALAQIVLNKGLRIAEIVQNTAAAQVRALAELGPIAGPPAAAKIGAFGRLQAAIVAATGLAQASGVGGGGGALGGGAAQGSTGGGGVAAQPIDLRIYGANQAMQAMMEPFFDALYEETKRGGGRFLRVTFG